MFEPLRFNNLLKAIPGLNHLKLTPQAEHHARTRTSVHVKEEIHVDTVSTAKHGSTTTHVHEDTTRDLHAGTHSGQETVVAMRDIRMKKTQRDIEGTTETLSHVHSTVIGVAEIEMTPPHLPREETPTYVKTHHDLVFVKDTPCAVCGVRKSTINDPKENLFGAKSIETHHYPIERSLLNACDLKKIRIIFPQVKDRASLEAFIDSEANMMVLCDIHHRHPHYGIHHLLSQDFFIQQFLYGGYEVVAEKEDEDKILAANEKIIKRHMPREEHASKS